MERLGGDMGAWGSEANGTMRNALDGLEERAKEGTLWAFTLAQETLEELNEC
jgi:hypothetical protein